jgi:predicted RNA binding protein YcfA (HicA-like mRNA interferase family)
VRFEELRRLLEAYGWTLDHVRGSHHIFTRESETFSVPLRRPHVLPVYVREALKRCAGPGGETNTVEERDGSRDI